MTTLRLLATVCALTCLFAPGSGAATPPGCTSPLEDFGDAPECLVAYPGGVLGRFPTCRSACAAGTRELECLPARSTPPGATGFLRHLEPTDGNRYWLGCYGQPGAGGGGIDAEGDGKVNTPGIGVSACAPGLATDCVEFPFGLSFDQDECYGDGEDAGITASMIFPACRSFPIPFTTAVCGPSRPAYLNILVDWNHDGDWNDNVSCAPGCAYEWAVKNEPLVLSNGCNLNYSPSFLSGPTPGPAWLRISLTDGPVPDDYPWNGSAGVAQGFFTGGETEDYPAYVDVPVPGSAPTWGQVKAIFR